ncbi:MAG: hypothetical protein JWR09_2163 [Mucilaginibacter sp.]|nr:hypothetical protein [Mucilaginibacter sp.]
MVMNYEHYSNLRYTEDYHLFMFISTGPKGNFKKIIAYTPIYDLQNGYNLGFGTLKINEAGNEYIDDNEVSDNGDRNKILATVASTSYGFIDRYPDSRIYLRGTNKVRTRLYQIAINYAYEELSKKFKISGDKSENTGTYDLYTFERGVNYNGFLVEKR